METTAPRLVLPFAIDEIGYAVALSDIVEVVPAYSLLRTPATGGMLLGMLNYRGVVVPLIDPTRRIAARGGDIATRQTFIVCGGADATCALLADEVFDLVEAAGANPAVAQGAAPSFSSVILIEDRPVPVLAIGGLLGELRDGAPRVEVDAATPTMEEVLQ